MSIVAARVRVSSVFLLAALFAPVFFLARNSRAQAAAPPPAGAPPPDATALVTAPKGPADAPKFTKAADDVTNASISAGGLWVTGNSNSLAGTANGSFDMRRGINGFGASLLANYAQGATPGNHEVATAENAQGRVRYDFYMGDRTSLFLIGTGRHDRFQGLEFRLNVDPGFKYLFLNEERYALWAEAGYDFQYDIRRDDARVQLDSTGAPIAGAPLLDKTATDHSGRVYVGFRQGFNKDVTFTTGLEYLQSFVESTRYRVNFDALVAAKLVGGLALGVGVSVRYDHNPLPGKKDTDTSTTVSLIYALSSAPKAAPCPPPEPPSAPPPPPEAPPADPPLAAPAPATMAPEPSPPTGDKETVVPPSSR